MLTVLGQVKLCFTARKLSFLSNFLCNVRRKMQETFLPIFIFEEAEEMKIYGSNYGSYFN